MRVRKIACLLGIAVVCVACTPSSEPQSRKLATLVLTNGEIRTTDGWVEAMAISENKIIAVGDATSIGDYVGEQTSIVDLTGKVVLPGLHDMHVHPLFGGMLQSGMDHTTCAIEQGSTITALQDTLRNCVARVSGAEWVTGGQWDASVLGDSLHREALDAVAPDTPVIINDTSGHSAWANSKALDLAGITQDSPDPEGGIIERDEAGNPTGILREAAIGLVRAKAPPPSDEVIRGAMEWSLQLMLSVGITSYTEASSGFVAGPAREAELYRELADEGVLKHRVQVCTNWEADNWVATEHGGEAVLENRERYERDRLSFDCVKLFLDGVPTDSHTAAMLEPYAGTMEGRDDDASRFGLLLMDQEIANEAVANFDQAGLVVKFHAAGDAAVRAGLNAIEFARKTNGMSKLRHDVGHCTFIAKDDLGRAKGINATFEMSPYLWSPSPINDDITNAIGEERIRRVWPLREAIDAGALVVAGSDWAVVPSVSPWIAIEALVTREEPGGSEKNFGKSQAITVEEAIDLFTVNSAKHMGTDGELGSIAVGMIADLIVVDQNPYEVEVYDLHKTKVMMTFIDGEQVFVAE